MQTIMNSLSHSDGTNQSHLLRFIRERFSLRLCSVKMTFRLSQSIQIQFGFQIVGTDRPRCRFTNDVQIILYSCDLNSAWNVVHETFASVKWFIVQNWFDLMGGRRWRMSLLLRWEIMKTNIVCYNSTHWWIVHNKTRNMHYGNTKRVMLTLSSCSCCKCGNRGWKIRNDQVWGR